MWLVEAWTAVGVTVTDGASAFLFGLMCEATACPEDEAWVPSFESWCRPCVIIDVSSGVTEWYVSVTALCDLLNRVVTWVESKMSCASSVAWTDYTSDGGELSCVDSPDWTTVDVVVCAVLPSSCEAVGVVSDGPPGLLLEVLSCECSAVAVEVCAVVVLVWVVVPREWSLWSDWSEV